MKVAVQVEVPDRQLKEAGLDPAYARRFHSLPNTYPFSVASPCLLNEV